MTDVVLPLITKRCSMKKEEGDEELMESILFLSFEPGGIIWAQIRKVSLGSFGPTLSSGKGRKRKGD